MAGLRANRIKRPRFVSGLVALAAIAAACGMSPALFGQEDAKPPRALDTPPRDVERPNDTSPKAAPLQDEVKSGVVRPPDVDPTMSKAVPNVDPAMPKTPKPPAAPPVAPKSPSETPDNQPR